jgi:hypothetical protein
MAGLPFLNQPCNEPVAFPAATEGNDRSVGGEAHGHLCEFREPFVVKNVPEWNGVAAVMASEQSFEKDLTGFG